jgi:hypothetical protein
MRPMTLLAAAAALALVGGALAASSGLLRPRPAVVPPLLAPSFSPLAVASAETTSPSPSRSSSPSPSPLGLKLAWSNVALPEHAPLLAWVGDRFALADLDSGSVRTSTDGENWETVQARDVATAYINLLSGSIAGWQDQSVGWLNPEDGPPGGGGDVAGYQPSDPRHYVTVVQPPAGPISTTPFKGHIESIGVGPRGMFAEVHSALDWDHWVTRKLGLKTNNDWTMHLKSTTFQDGVLQIKLTGGRPGLKVNWADEGFEPGDFQDRGFAWFSPDGAHWTKLPPNPKAGPFDSTLPTGGFGQVVGVSDGFIATGACTPDGCDLNGLTGIWYSGDGLTWRLLGNESGGGDLRPWLGGALVGNGDFWTSAGSSKLPIAADLSPQGGTVGVGPLGLVIVTTQQALVSRNGIDSGLSPIPADMAAASHSRGGPTVAVGDEMVLVLETVRGEVSATHSLWLGKLQP